MTKTILVGIATLCLSAVIALASEGGPNSAVLSAVALEPGSQASTDGLRMREHAAASELTVAIVPIAPEFRYYAEMSDGATERAEVAGVEVIVDGPTGSGDNVIHADILAEMSERDDVDAIILSLRDAEIAAPAIEQAVESGILVVLANADFTSFPTPIHAVVGYHQVEANEAMGRFAADLIEDGEQIALVGGAPGYHAERAARGFTRGLGGDAEMIVFQTNGRWNVDGGRAAGKAILTEHPGVDLVWAANDNMIMGVADALEAEGRDNVILLGRDGDPTAIAMVESGILTATVDTDPYGIGHTAMDVVLAVFEGAFGGGYVPTSTKIIANDAVPGGN